MSKLAVALRKGPAAAALIATLAGCGGQPQQVAAGQELFEANCAACHGPAGSGTDQGPPLVHEIYEPSHHPDEAFHAAVRGGVAPHHWDFGPMPPLAGLDDGEVDAIVAYVRQLQQDAGIR